MATVEHDNGAKVPAEGGGEENVEFESDSDEGTSALALRRRVASDDEEDNEEAKTDRKDDYYDEDLEHHEGGPPLEEDEDEEEEDEEEEYEDAEDEGIAGRKESEDYDNEEDCEEVKENVRKPQGNAPTGVSNDVGSEEKKDAEPFVVPTAGAFYMHDDRFRYNGLARPRRSAGGRKLWEAKDEKPWVHDRFEELKLQEEGYSGQGVRGRRGRGRQGRAQGRSNDAEHTRGKGIRERKFDDLLRSTRRGPGRGRGLRRAKMDDYEFRESHVISSRGVPPSSSETPSSTSKQPAMQNLASSQPIIKPQDQDATSKKPTISSMLKVSSPPFFPTGAVLQSLSGAVTGTSKVSEDSFAAQRDVPLVGKLASTSRIGMERDMAGLTPDSTARQPSGPEISTGLASASINGDGETGLHRNLARGSSTLQQQQLSKTGSGAMIQQQRSTRAELSALLADQSLPSQTSTRGAPSPTQPRRVQSAPAPFPQTGNTAHLTAQSMRVQHPLKSHPQMQAKGQTQIASGQSMQSQQVSFPVSFSATKQPAIDLKPSQSPLGSSLGSGTIGRGTQTVTMQAGRGTVVYGSSSLANGLRSVVQFAGQPQAGLGVPTVGVALPGYANQPQFSFPNSEVTWIPILAGGGSLSSNYSSPYIAVDGGSSAMYYTQQGPSLGDMNSSKAVTNNPLKNPPRTESDDLGQQRRRYSQMTFGEERR